MCSLLCEARVLLELSDSIGEAGTMRKRTKVIQTQLSEDLTTERADGEESEPSVTPIDSCRGFAALMTQPVLEVVEK